MKINWKVRFKNKAFVVTFATVVIAFVYQLLALFNVAPVISEDYVTQCVMFIVNLLGVLGVLIDPTTEGTGDSDRALSYTVPGGEDEQH